VTFSTPTPHYTHHRSAAVCSHGTRSAPAWSLGARAPCDPFGWEPCDETTKAYNKRPIHAAIVGMYPLGSRRCSGQHELDNLMRCLRLAVEWGVLESAPKMDLLSGERRRERVVTVEEEARYLAVATPLLASVAAILADTGLRPDECHRLRWEDITWVRAQRNTACDSWEDSCSPAGPADESESQIDLGTTMGRNGKAIRRMDLACTN
jgi:DNA polymerase III psi subunit